MATKSDADSPVIETQRLLLIPFRIDDADELLKLFRDADVRHYLLDDQLVDRAWVDQEIDTSDRRFSDGSIGIWSIRQLSSPKLAIENTPIIGFAGFRPFFDPPELQLIYGLLSSAWGKGFATEAARAAINFGFEQAKLATVIAATDQPNVASVAVMKRLGMEPDRVSDAGDQGTIFYRIDGNR